MPCTEGSPWQRINVKKPGGFARLRKHVKLFNNLWHNFEILARQAHKVGNPVAIEWPSGCSYWQFPKVKGLLKELDLEYVDFHGCMLGLKSVVDGKPILKPWRLATNCPNLIDKFRNLKCKGRKEHRPCAGRDTKIHEGWQKILHHAVTCRRCCSKRQYT